MFSRRDSVVENREVSGLLLVIWTRQRSSEMFVKAAVGCRPALVRPALVTGAVDGSFMGLTYGRVGREWVI